MNVVYNAEHTLRIDLEHPVKHLSHEIDSVRISVQWVEADEEGPEGWYLTGTLLGWPLTAKGKRDKRAQRRETVRFPKYPANLWLAVRDARSAALTRSGIHPDSVVNWDEGLFNDVNWEPQPADVFGSECVDCSIKVTYNNDGFWPWVGVDQTEICSVNANDHMRGHRIPRDDADAIFATHERRTGERARHR